METIKVNEKEFKIIKLLGKVVDCETNFKN